jgi:hypothetical protein
VSLGSHIGSRSRPEPNAYGLEHPPRKRQAAWPPSRDHLANLAAAQHTALYRDPALDELAGTQVLDKRGVTAGTRLGQRLRRPPVGADAA